MKCKKCKAEIPKDCLYCKVCGNEVQLVPDYNFLDDDLLSNLLENKEAEDVLEELAVEDVKKKSVLIWGGIAAAILAAVATLFLLYQDIRKKQINTYEYQYKEAVSYMQKKDYANAVSSFEHALTFKPKDKEVRSRLLEIYLLIGEDEQAISILEEFMEEDKTNEEVCRQLIELYDKNKEYKEISELRESIEDLDLLPLFSAYMVAEPKFSSIGGKYANPLNISITSENGYDIFYTADGKDPVFYGKPYQNAIPLKEEGTTILMAVARNEKGVYSKVIEEEYTIEYEAPAMPKVTPQGGEYYAPEMIVVQVPANCIAYYTWDGSNPTRDSFVYGEPIEMPPGEHILSVMLVNSVGLESEIYRGHYIRYEMPPDSP